MPLHTTPIETKLSAIFSVAADQVSTSRLTALISLQPEERSKGGPLTPLAPLPPPHHLVPQARRMRQGACRSIVAFYQGLTLVHVNLAPLVLTFASRDADANVGMILDSYSIFEQAFSPLRAAVELHEKETSSRLF